MAADMLNLNKIWDKNIEKHKGDQRWVEWKQQTLSNNKSKRSTTFLILEDNEPIGEGTILWSPECEAIVGREQLADGRKTVNVNALRIEKTYEGQGHISKLVKMMEQVAKEKGLLEQKFWYTLDQHLPESEFAIIVNNHRIHSNLKDLELYYDTYVRRIK